MSGDVPPPREPAGRGGEEETISTSEADYRGYPVARQLDPMAVCHAVRAYANHPRRARKRREVLVLPPESLEILPAVLEMLRSAKEPHGGIGVISMDNLLLSGDGWTAAAAPPEDRTLLDGNPYAREIEAQLTGKITAMHLPRAVLRTLVDKGWRHARGIEETCQFPDSIRWLREWHANILRHACLRCDLFRECDYWAPLQGSQRYTVYDTEHLYTHGLRRQGGVLVILGTSRDLARQISWGVGAVHKALRETRTDGRPAIPFLTTDERHLLHTLAEIGHEGSIEGDALYRWLEERLGKDKLQALTLRWGRVRTPVQIECMTGGLLPGVVSLKPGPPDPSVLGTPNRSSFGPVEVEKLLVAVAEEYKLYCSGRLSTPVVKVEPERITLDRTPYWLRDKHLIIVGAWKDVQRSFDWLERRFVTLDHLASDGLAKVERLTDFERLRRALLRSVSAGVSEISASELAERAGVGLPAVSKHKQRLSDATGCEIVSVVREQQQGAKAGKGKSRTLIFRLARAPDGGRVVARASVSVAERGDQLSDPRSAA